MTNLATYAMLDSQVPQIFTIYAARHACTILATTATMVDNIRTTGYRALFGTDFDVRLIKRFGCEVFILLEKDQRLKFGSKGVRGIHLGLSQKHADWTFIVYIPSSGLTLFRRDVLIYLL